MVEFHRASFSPIHVGMGQFDMSIAPDRIVLNLGTRTGNVWTGWLTEDG